MGIHNLSQTHRPARRAALLKSRRPGGGSRRKPAIRHFHSAAIVWDRHIQVSKSKPNIPLGIGLYVQYLRERNIRGSSVVFYPRLVSIEHKTPVASRQPNAPLCIGFYCVYAHIISIRGDERRIGAVEYGEIVAVIFPQTTATDPEVVIRVGSQSARINRETRVKFINTFEYGFGVGIKADQGFVCAHPDVIFGISNRNDVSIMGVFSPAREIVLGKYFSSARH